MNQAALFVKVDSKRIFGYSLYVMNENEVNPPESVFLDPELESIRLLRGESLIFKKKGMGDQDEYTRRVEINNLPDQPLDPIKALMLLTKAEEEKIGRNGLIQASTSLHDMADKALQLFQAGFGRDALEFSKKTIDLMPQIAHSTIRHLAQLQGISGEEEGQIMHEYRHPDDPIREALELKLGWTFPYYGSVDSTLMFIQLIGTYVRRKGREILEESYTGRDGVEHKIEHALLHALGWLKRKMDQSPQGFIEYKKGKKGDIENQAWKDSLEAYHHSDGRLADNTYGIASFSVQVEAYKALQAAWHLMKDQQKVLHNRIGALRNSILDRFWIEDERGGYFALGLERQADETYIPLTIRTSDMGHILDSDLLAGNDPNIVRMREMLIETLFSKEMLAVSGVRTLSNGEVRFNPGAYHNGSVWPRENARIARGLKRHGYYGLTLDLHKRTLNVWQTTKIFPELVRGGNEPKPTLNYWIVLVKSEDRKQPYKLQQPGQEIQAWSVSAVMLAQEEIGKAERGESSKVATDPDKRKLEEGILGYTQAAA